MISAGKKEQDVPASTTKHNLREKREKYLLLCLLPSHAQAQELSSMLRRESQNMCLKGYDKHTVLFFSQILSHSDSAKYLYLKTKILQQ